VFNIKLYYDLHIHSVLSPCADELMTPNNILNMAMLNELDIIAITDHNSTKQLAIFEELSESYDMVIVPGIEVSVVEGFDVLCYFPSFHTANVFGDFIEKHLSNDWGPYTKDDQVITNIYDLIQDTYDLPLQSTTLTYHELVSKVRELDGAIILAHIDRKMQSPLRTYNLQDIEFDGIEIQKYFKDTFTLENDDLSNYKVFHNSDSHSLLQISDKEEWLDIKDKSIEGFLLYLRGEQNE